MVDFPRYTLSPVAVLEDYNLPVRNYTCLMRILRYVRHIHFESPLIRRSLRLYYKWSKPYFQTYTSYVLSLQKYTVLQARAVNRFSPCYICFVVAPGWREPVLKRTFALPVYVPIPELAYRQWSLPFICFNCLLFVSGMIAEALVNPQLF